MGRGGGALIGMHHSLNLSVARDLSRPFRPLTSDEDLGICSSPCMTTNVQATDIYLLMDEQTEL